MAGWMLGRWGSTIGLVLAAASALGCAPPSPKYRPSLVLSAPTPPQFLEPVPARALGKLRPATEGELSLIDKALPLGAIVDEIHMTDTDTAMRVIGPGGFANLRVTEHERNRRSVRLLGPTKDGLLRVQVTYAERSAKKLDNGHFTQEQSPVQGKSYIIDVGAAGIRVLTPEGYTPPPLEVMAVQEDYKTHAKKRSPEGALRNARRDAHADLSPSEAVLAQLRRSLESGGIVIHELRADLRGVREHDGVPCAVFGVLVQGDKDSTKGEISERSSFDLQGEYSVRLGDGWEAELALGGLRRIRGQTKVQGVPVTFDSLGRMRLWVQSRYDLSQVEKHRTLESLER